jgi:hypothetical protein
MDPDYDPSACAAYFQEWVGQATSSMDRTAVQRKNNLTNARVVTRFRNST